MTPDGAAVVYRPSTVRGRAVALAAPRYPGFIDPFLTGMHLGERNLAYLERTAIHPTRFMVGTDVETRSYFNQSEGESADHNPHTGVAEYVGSVSNYIAYLQFGVDHGIIDQATMDRVRGWNAKEVYDF